MKKTVDLGWCVAKLDGMHLTIMHPAGGGDAFYEPAQSVMITRKPDIEALRDLLLEAFPVEAQLGAAPRVAATREDAGATTGDANGSAAAPSVSAETWAGLARAFRKNNYINAPRACDLAAAVTRWYERADNRLGELDTVEGLYNIACAFARGEKLPEVPNG